jgi:protein TonB
MARHRINEDGHMIWFDDDDEYNAYLEEKAELRRKQEEAAAEEAAEEEKVDTILKVGCFVIVLIFLGILGLCSSSNKKKEKRGEETFRTEKREAKTKEQIEQNTYVVSPVQSEKASVQLDNEIISEPEIDAFDEAVFDEIEVLEEDVFEEEIEPDFSRQKIYQSVEVDEEPKFPGGEHELMKYIADNVVYPQTAIDEGIQGRVIVSFVVEPNGKVTNVEVLRGIGGGCDEEAVRVVKSLPNWEAGVRRGKNVRVAIAVPVKFALE